MDQKNKNKRKIKLSLKMYFYLRLQGKLLNFSRAEQIKLRGNLV